MAIKHGKYHRMKAMICLSNPVVHALVWKLRLWLEEAAVKVRIALHYMALDGLGNNLACINDAEPCTALKCMKLPCDHIEGS